ncbi:hypothetical protein SOVF_158210, partial [Spinacia oleracea]
MFSNPYYYGIFSFCIVIITQDLVVIAKQKIELTSAFLRYYYAYDNYEERLKPPPERVPEANFKTLIAYWETNAAKKTSCKIQKIAKSETMVTYSSPEPCGIPTKYAVANLLSLSTIE